MIAFPNAKINLGLYITGKRDDGYHNIASIFLPIGLKDALEVLPSNTTSLNIHGMDVPGREEDNLCWKAYKLLKQDFDIPPVAIHLLKHIPMGAGLGGGSADGAFMLKLLNEQFELRCSTIQLEDYAAQLGSDCIFFIQNTAAYVTGRGEIIEGCPLDLSGYQAALVYPKLHMSTAEAYQYVQLCQPNLDLKQLQNTDLTKVELINAFEQVFFQKHPHTQDIKSMLQDSGAIYASLSGSGSAFYGIFERTHSDFTAIKHFCLEHNYDFFLTNIL
ncbi:MAG: 4-(cytidine 5'-diphospho)-2-C-methyl-D-erythritol kinase [Saprospiraceae bacterium]|nr:4-(cytidine 5'-diphospho)-2-C-methyl-D-erythritol kinase [Saprospiraceae bacterium]